MQCVAAGQAGQKRQYVLGLFELTYPVLKIGTSLCIVQYIHKNSTCTAYGMLYIKEKNK